jgi:hypothetical protein
MKRHQAGPEGVHTMKDYCLAGSIANDVKFKEGEKAAMVVSIDSWQPFRGDGPGCPRGILAAVALQTIVMGAGLMCWGLCSLLR